MPIYAQPPAEEGGVTLMPDYDRTRRERLGYRGERFRTPGGFRVEEVAGNEQVGSVVNLSFDALGRPLLALEGRGLVLLEDRDRDGRFETTIEVSTEIETAHGLYPLGPGELLVHADGPDEGAGLYRLQDLDGDERADRVELVMASRGGIQEHGPHTVTRGSDGALYVLYGNMAYPDVEPAPSSPLRKLEEDQLLPRLLDPRGHANTLRAPGGTIHRVDLESGRWELLAGGLRNPFDMAISLDGELFVYEADMEWDRGLPWFRPTRVLHAIPAGDYGWRTGSGKFPFYLIDTLPSVVDIGRGSPVGVVFYHHHHYPQRFRGALFMGDWSRGRIRVLFPQRDGATWTGAAADFVLGEPLNVTDLDVGPDGLLYFTAGGRSTSGGLYRVAYDGEGEGLPVDGIDAALDQPMPRSAWGRRALARIKGELGERWEPALWQTIESPERTAEERLRALELLQIYGPEPSLGSLERLLTAGEPRLRAAAVALLGGFPFPATQPLLVTALADSDPLVARRACEGLVRSGLGGEAAAAETIERLHTLLDHRHRFVRYAAREALLRTEPARWLEAVGRDSVSKRPHGAVEGLLLLVYAQNGWVAGDGTAARGERLLLDKLREYGPGLPPGNRPARLDYLRVLELALARAPDRNRYLRELDSLGPWLLELYRRPATADSESARQLERLLAIFEPPGALAAMLARLTPERPQEDQIHTVYCLRVMRSEWTVPDRGRLVAWFDRAREMRGAASMAGYIDLLWEDVLSFLPAEERRLAEERRARRDLERARRRAALIDKVKKDTPPDQPALSQMSFDELAEYLEYDVMAYEREVYSPERGALVFERARCASCHVFGDLGRGGGPDLSTVIKRLRRREILESIMYPSRVISDQYRALEVELRRGRLESGMVVEESDEHLILISAAGERLRLHQSRIVARRPSPGSIMPDGLLDTMDLGDLVSLIRFLETAVEE